MEKKQCEMNSLSRKILTEIILFLAETLTLLRSLNSDPLFSFFVAIYTLILLYLPRIFLDLIFSPILISTAILLSTLLRLGSIQRAEKRNFSDFPHEDPKWVSCEADIETKMESEAEKIVETERFFAESFFEWNVRAPLEVIYEEYEGEEECNSNEKEETRQVGTDGLESLALYYPESDTGSSSDGECPAIKEWDSPDNMLFRWEEDDKEGLIEIALDGKRSSVFQVEEENLIEIDISPIGAPVEKESFPAFVRFS